MKPAEGTILTVSRLAAAEAVSEAEHNGDIEIVLENALKAGYEALANTINQNPVLKRAGVVDAGGKGYLYILDGMLKALRGEKLTAGQDKSAAAGGVPSETREKADFSGFKTEDIKFTYCTEFIAGRQTSKDVALLRRFLDERGDSIVVVDDDEVIKVHVHSNEPGVIITEALTYGPLLTIKVENMREQHTGKVVEGSSAAAPAAAKAPPAPVEPEKEFGVVAVCAGDGMTNVFHDLGVDNIIVGGQTMNPSTEDILTQIQATPSHTVFVLPNNKNIIMAAQQCIPLTEKTVVVIPSKTMPQGISALIALDASATAEENAAAMTEAITRVHTVQITYAARDSVFDNQEIHAGDYLALLEDSLIATGKDALALIDNVAAALSGFSPEFITVFSGEDADEQMTSEVLKRLDAAVTGAEISVVSGGQPVYYYLISAE
jgi:DAK2 domain fusion protein YloV